MSEIRNDPMEARLSRRLWKRRQPLAFVLAAGVMGAGAALAVNGANHPPMPPGGNCGWGNLKGDLATAPKFVLAFDGDFNVQGFFRPGGPGVPKDEPAEKPTPDAEVFLEKHGEATVYCYKIGGQRRCIED